VGLLTQFSRGTLKTRQIPRLSNRVVVTVSDDPVEPVSAQWWVSSRATEQRDGGSVTGGLVVVTVGFVITAVRLVVVTVGFVIVAVRLVVVAVGSGR